MALNESVARYSLNKIPLDAQWSDIDYMHNYRNFEYDKQAFEGLPDFIQNLHKKNIKWVPIIDAGLARRDGGDYEAFEDGLL